MKKNGNDFPLTEGEGAGEVWGKEVPVCETERAAVRDRTCREACLSHEKTEFEENMQLGQHCNASKGQNQD